MSGKKVLPEITAEGMATELRKQFEKQKSEADGRYLARESENIVPDGFSLTIAWDPDDPNNSLLIDYLGIVAGGYGGNAAEPIRAIVGVGEFLLEAGTGGSDLKYIRFYHMSGNDFGIESSNGATLDFNNLSIIGIKAPETDSSPVPKSYVDGLIGDIAAILDNINGEVV